MDNYILGLDAKDNATPKIEKFGKKLKEVEGKFSGFGGKLGNALKELPGFGGALDIIGKGPLLGFAAGIGAAAIGVGSFIKSSIDFADEMNDMSIKLGISTEKLSVLKLYAEQSGTTIETLSQNMGKLGVKIANGDSDLKKYGVTAGSTDEALFQLADKIANTEDPMMRLKIATDAFGKSGQEMLPLLVQGGEALRTMSQEAPIVSTELAKMADEFNDKMAVMKGRFTTIGLGIAESVLPQLEKWLEGVDRIRIAFGMLNKEESKAKEKSDIIEQYQKLIDARKEGEKLIGPVKGAITIDGKTLKQQLDAVDKKYEPKEELPKPKTAGYKSEEEIKKEEQLKKDAAKKIKDEAEKAKKEKEKEGAENLKALQEEWKRDGNAKIASDAKTQKELEAAADARDEIEKEKKRKLTDDQKSKEDQDLADKQAKYREFANAAASNLSQPLNTFFTDISSGNANVLDSFADLFGNIAEGFKNMLIQMVSEMLAKAAIFALLNAITGGGASGLLGGGAGAGGGLFGLPGFAQGTNYAPGGISLVGEAGPELVNLPRGSKVTPNNKSFSNQLTINLNGTNFSEKDVIRIATEANRKINRDAKWRGKN